jgi:hypothetical protein
MYNNQRNKVLELLQNAGANGINGYDLTYRHKIKQAPTRIFELREQGYAIESRKNPNKSVTYILLGSPASTGTTQAVIQPQKHINSWDVPMERYEKDGKFFWREIV